MKKIAIIGMGGISAVHVASILSENLGVISAICDIREDRMDKASQSIPYEVKRYTDWKMMLDEVKPEVVHVCTPHYLHAEMAIKAMENGADVYLEKPAAMNYDEGLKILDTEYITENYAAAFAKENTELLEKFNTALAELKAEGKVDEIIAKYIKAE